MSVLDKPDDDNNDKTNKDKDKVIPSFSSSSNMGELSIEKQFTHRMFLGQISNIDINTAKQLLADLHMLYLSQMQVVSKIAKQDFLDTFK
jgi:hypothetical protein